MTKLYWWLRWLIWDAREALFVRECARVLRGNRIVFVHPHGEAPSAAYIARIEDVTTVIDVEPHSHVEGKMRAG